MTEARAKRLANARLLRDIIIAIGVFVPLLNYVHHLLQSYAGPVNIFLLPSDEQFMLLALTLVPLLVLRLVYAPLCSVQKNSRRTTPKQK